MRVKEDTRKHKKGFLKEMKENKILYAMCVPALLVLLLFCYIPFTGVWMAFTDYNILDGIFGSKFVGLDNFKYFFIGNSTAWKVTFNTLTINIFCIFFGLIVPISIAIFFHEVRLKVFKRLTQSAMFFPYFLSWVVVGAIVYGFFASDVGLVNRIRESFGLEAISWYASPKYWKPIIIFASVWKWSGYNSIIYMAAMSNFDRSLFEASEIDGANKIQRILYLTLPMLKPTAVVLVLLSVGRIFYGDFGMIYGIVGNNPSLADTVTVIDTYVYQSMRTLGFSYSTAIGLYQSIMGLILVTLANKFAKKINDGEGLF